MRPDSFSDQLALWGIRPSTGRLWNAAEFHRKDGATPKCAPYGTTLGELEIRRPSLQARLRYSLGLNPWPERTALNPGSSGNWSGRGIG